MDKNLCQLIQHIAAMIETQVGVHRPGTQRTRCAIIISVYLRLLFICHYQLRYIRKIRYLRQGLLVDDEGGLGRDGDFAGFGFDGGEAFFVALEVAADDGVGAVGDLDGAGALQSRIS